MEYGFILRTPFSLYRRRKMSEKYLNALESAWLYSNDAIVRAIADSLETSKSQVQVLMRKGINISISEKSGPSDLLEAISC
ncbi:hypothetical protein ES703_12956 [subsurface metagenome]